VVAVELTVDIKFHSFKMPLYQVTRRQTNVGSAVNGGEW
jgi:hypothetical protein